jgi:amino acid transporter
MLFVLGGSRFAEIAQILFITSIFAATLSFHNAVARYMFALGRERVLPRAVGRTNPRTGSPQVASMLQSTIGFAVIALFAAAGLDPVVQLFFWIGTSGAFGVLILLAATSLAVIGFFIRGQSGENIWSRIIAPGLSSVALSALIWKAIDDYAALLGVEPDNAMAWILPSTFLVAAVLGVLWALVLRNTRKDVYDSIGLGPNATVARRSN